MFHRSRKYRPSKLIKRKRKVLAVKVGFVIGAAILLVISLSWFSYYDGLTIRAIIIEGNSVVETKKIEATVVNVLEGRYFFLFSRLNIVIYSRKQIKELLLNNFKRIENVSVKATDFTSIKIIVKERSSYALWCKVVEIETEESIIETKETCYFLDKEGFIFATAPDFTGNIFFKYFSFTENKNTSDESPIGSQFLTKKEFLEVDLLRSFFLSDQSILTLDSKKPVALTIVNDKDLELTLSDGSRYLFSRDQDVSKMLTNIQSIFSSDIFNEEDSKIDYIDLRFGNKVYYKFK